MKYFFSNFFYTKQNQSFKFEDININYFYFNTTNDYYFLVKSEKFAKFYMVSYIFSQFLGYLIISSTLQYGCKFGFQNHLSSELNKKLKEKKINKTTLQN